MEVSAPDLYHDFDVFARALVVSGDVDPVYPVIKGILEAHPEFQPEWFVFSYGAFYSLRTAVEFCREYPDTGTFLRRTGDFLRRRREGQFSHFGHERRGTCRNPLNQIELFKAATLFINAEIESSNLKNRDNLTFRQILEGYPWHGSWSCYKIAEVFEKSLGWTNLKINDLGIEGRDPNSNDGPIGGLRWLFGREQKFNSSWFPIWDRFGARLSEAYGWGIGETETCLCKWNKIVSGKYFVGHDIQEFVELKHVLNPQTFKNIMSTHFNVEFWQGIKALEKHKKSHYLKTGEILNSKFGEPVMEVNIEQIILDL